MVKARLLEVNLLMDPQFGLYLGRNRVNILCQKLSIGFGQVIIDTCDSPRVANEENLLPNEEYNSNWDKRGKPKEGNSYGFGNIVVLSN